MKSEWMVLTVLWLAAGGLWSCGSDEDGSRGVEKSVVEGIIEKGPFVQGSKVMLYELTDGLLQTGKGFKAQTKDDLGSFRFETAMSLESQFVELETTGYFYNEWKGGLSASQITLNALSDVGSRNAVNVNLITHLEMDRVKRLVGKGNSFDAAKRQAERELLACFAITDEISLPEAISITDNNKNSAILLAISTVMLYDKDEAQFTEFISKFSVDFADNGQIDNSLIRQTIADGQLHARPAEVIERMKKFYAEKGVTMECDDFSPYIDFNGDGIIDEHDKEVLVVEPVNQIVSEDFWTSKTQLMQVLASCYLKGTEFAQAQLLLEGIRTGLNGGVHSITPETSAVDETYTNAYKTIGGANVLIQNAPLVKERDGSLNEAALAALTAEAKCLRAFAYYNMAMLWDNVVIAKEGTDVSFDMPAPSKQAEVYHYAYNDVCEAVEKLPVAYDMPLETQSRFTRGAALMLKAELELTMGRTLEAKATLNNVESTILFGFSRQEDDILLVYSANRLNLYSKEANGITEGLAEEWAALTDSHYGYWAALKRLGKAQEVTHCYDYELLMPFPTNDLRVNTKLAQNPGYK